MFKIKNNNSIILRLSIIFNIFFIIIFTVYLINKTNIKNDSQHITTNDNIYKSVNYLYSDLMDNSIDNQYYLLISKPGISQIEYRDYQFRYYEIWKEEYDKIFSILKNKAIYEEDITNINNFDTYIQNMLKNNRNFILTELLDNYTVSPDTPGRNFGGNGTNDKLAEIKGKIYRNGCMLIVPLLDDSEYQFPQNIDFSKVVNHEVVD